jgi:hypothetical protein
LYDFELVARDEYLKQVVPPEANKSGRCRNQSDPA